MKIGLLPRLDSAASNNNHAGIGDVRWSSNIYHYLKMLGYDVEYIPHDQSQDCDIYFDIHTRELCDECAAKRHVHLSFYSQNYIRTPEVRKCEDGHDKIIGTSYHRTYIEDTQQGVVNLPVFCPTPYPEEWRSQALLRIEPFQRNEITWAVRNAPSEWQANMEAALSRLMGNFDAKVNHIVAQSGAGRIPWQEVLIVLGRTKINLYCDDQAGASTNEAMFCGALPLLPRNNLFWYVPDGVGNPQTSEEMYVALESRWTDQNLYNQEWEHYQQVFSDHVGAKLEQHWHSAIDYIMSQPERK